MRNETFHFSQVPRAEIQRSRFDRSNRHLTTWSAGELIPIYCDEILPGDTVSMDMASLVRMTTPIFPVMDNAFMDVYFFFVPNRLVWEHWKEFNGENVDGYWTQTTEYNVPQLIAPAGGWNKGSLADHFELPIDVPNYEVSALPFRGYVKIWNEWFRDQNYMPAAYFSKDDSNRTGAPRILDNNAAFPDEDIPVTTALLGGGVLPVAKTHDYFTSVLPAPQKGPAVGVPFVSGDMPVTTMSKYIPERNDNYVSMRWQYGSGGLVTQANSFLGVATDGSTLIRTSDAGNTPGNTGILPANLWVQLANVDVGTINELRMAFQIQKLYERDARSGSRYTEILKSHFGVTSPDSRLQRPEYLGGKRIPINIDQVVQTSSTNSTSPQGNTAAFSLTVDRDSMFTKSFTEHGYIFGLACIRTDHTYQQGVDRFWSRKRRFDFYWPALAHIGEQAVLKKEILCTGDESDNNAFGYQEAWADYRFKQSHVTGAFRSTYDETLDSWHYADMFVPSNPEEFVADSQFMRETRVNVDRTLAVNSSLEDQFFGDFYFKSIWTRPMPVYSVPGLIDHF